jgi:NIMA-interacting peptidyl-prolyl cis-trans isomerase 1
MSMRTTSSLMQQIRGVAAQQTHNSVALAEGATLASAIAVEVPEALRDVPPHIVQCVPMEKLTRQVPHLEVPKWAAQPRSAATHLAVSKEGAAMTPIPLGRFPFYLLGQSERVCDSRLLHPSVSRVHCGIVHHASGAVFVIDMDSQNGVQVNGERIAPHSYVRITEGDVIQLGASTRLCTLKLGGDAKSAAKPAVGAAAADRKRARSPVATDAAASKPTAVTEETNVVALAAAAAAAIVEKEPEVTERRFYHVLIKHNGVANAVSKAPRNKGEAVTRSLADAIKIADYLKKGKTDEQGRVASLQVFAELVSTFSECGTAKKGGDVGTIKRGTFVEEFETAAFGLPEALSLSDPTTTKLGVHLILRAE